jgi:SAM-dependent methyltransferase
MVETASRPSRLATSSDPERQRDYWESDLGHREVDHPVVATFSRQRWAHLAGHLPMGEIKLALDVGAGNGFSTAHAPRGMDVVATDGSWRMLRRHPGPHRAMADAQQLPFADAAFDLAYCWELLHHVPEPWRVLKEMARVSRRWVLLFEPNPLNPAQAAFAVADPEHRWVLRYSRSYLLDQVRLAGLRAVSHETCGLIFPNKTPSALAALLSNLPFRMPFGISHLVVAERA